MHVSGPVPGLCDAVVQLYDGHGGKHAARYCVANLVPYVEEAFFAHPRAKPHAPNGDRDALALDVDKDTGFHPALDDALVAAFERLDAEIKRDDPSGTTAAVILLKLGKKQEDGTLSSDGGGGGSNVRDVHVKCAWVGDSRAVLCRDFDAQRVMDLSVDHKPESESEKVRIAKHYEKLGASFKSREEVLSSPEASVRAGSVHRGSANASGSESGDSSRVVTREAGMPEVEMTLGPGAAMEEAVFGEGSGRGGSQGRGQQGAATIGNLNPVTLSKSDLTELEDLSNRGSRGVVAPAESETWMRAAPARSERGSRLKTKISAAESSAVEAAERLAAQIAASSEEESDAGEDEEDEPVSLKMQAAYDEVRSGAAAGRISFVGFYKDDDGLPLSKPRVFSSSGESHGVSRSIGDRGSARACVATPEVRSVTIPAGSRARIVVGSDGVWDCFSSERAVRKIGRFQTAPGAAKRMCAFAKEAREYSGLAADDITAVVVDVGENLEAGAPACACVVS